MSRSFQYIGLTQRASNFVKYAKAIETNSFTFNGVEYYKERIDDPFGGEQHVLGMWLRGCDLYIEKVQLEIWHGGPVIYTCLQKVTNKNIFICSPWVSTEDPASPWTNLENGTISSACVNKDQLNLILGNEPNYQELPDIEMTMRLNKHGKWVWVGTGRRVVFNMKDEGNYDVSFDCAHVNIQDGKKEYTLVITNGKIQEEVLCNRGNQKVKTPVREIVLPRNNPISKMFH